MHFLAVRKRVLSCHNGRSWQPKGDTRLVQAIISATDPKPPFVW